MKVSPYVNLDLVGKQNLTIIPKHIEQNSFIIRQRTLQNLQIQDIEAFQLTEECQEFLNLLPTLLGRDSYVKTLLKYVENDNMLKAFNQFYQATPALGELMKYAN